MATTEVLPSLVAATTKGASVAVSADRAAPVRNAGLVIARVPVVPVVVNDRQVPPKREVRVVNSVEDLIAASADKATTARSEGPHRLRRPCRTSRSRLRPTTKALIRSRVRSK